MISFIIPAHNEERLLGRTLEALVAAAGRLGERYELIVVDDASTDRTAEVARRHGAVVEQVALRKISAVRNAGAKRASGDILIFVDADTVVPVEALAAALRALRNGAAAGGAVVAFDEYATYWAAVMVWVWNLISRLGRYAAGCFVFVRKDAFEAVGGFHESYYVGEELVLSEALRRRGRFVVLAQPVYTSSRKAKAHTLREMAGLFGGLLLGSHRWQTREGKEMWYDRRTSNVE